MARESHTDLFFTTENGGWGWGQSSLLRHTPQPVNRGRCYYPAQPASFTTPCLIKVCNGLLILSNLGARLRGVSLGFGGGGGLLRVLPRRAGSVALVPALQNDVTSGIQIQQHSLGSWAAAAVCVCTCVCTCVRVYMCAP